MISPARKTATIGALAAFALGATGCSSVNTAPDQAALHYEGGSVQSQKFKGCVDPSTREYNGPGDKHYVYPSNQRTYDFTGKEGSDAGVISISTKDVIPMAVPGLVRFQLNTDCEVLRKFHELIGNREQAYFDDSANPSDGWRKVLDQFIGRQIDATLDREALAYNWREIYTDPTVKAKLEQSLDKSLQELVNANTEGDEQFFNILSVQIQKPEPPQELLAALTGEQTKIASANASKAEAEAQVATELARLALEEARAAARQAEIAGYGSAEEFNKAKAIEKGINPYQPTYVVPQAGS